MIHVKSIFKSSKKAIDVKIGTAQKIKFSIKDFFSKCDQIHSFLWIWSHLLKKILNGKPHYLCSVVIYIDISGVNQM